MGKLVFITGGARSGKSTFALAEARGQEGRRVFLATLEPGDEEMRLRAERHRADRGSGWDTIEEPLAIAVALRKLSVDYDVVLLDCLTLWLSNVLHSGLDAGAESEGLASALDSARRSAAVYVVSNELGAGIVPHNALARQFRDHAGMLNQRVAALADEAYLMVSGIAVRLKGQ